MGGGAEDARRLDGAIKLRNLWLVQDRMVGKAFIVNWTSDVLLLMMMIGTILCALHQTSCRCCNSNARVVWSHDCGSKLHEECLPATLPVSSVPLGFQQCFFSMTERETEKRLFSQPGRELFFSWHFQSTSNTASTSPSTAEHTTTKSFSRSSRSAARLCQEKTDVPRLSLNDPAGSCFLFFFRSPLLFVEPPISREASRRRGTTPPSRVRHAASTLSQKMRDTTDSDPFRAVRVPLAEMSSDVSCCQCRRNKECSALLPAG